MKPFAFSRAGTVADASTLGASNGSKFIAGGTNILDLMKEGVEGPDRLVDITRLPLTTVKALAKGGVTIGALARNSETANHPIIRRDYPLLAQAIFAGASAQIRNMATNGGNLMQRTRCAYFYDTATFCNKREPGTGCSAKEGLNRNHAILGWSAACVATHPSDMCVALAALDAVVKVRGTNGAERSIPFADFHRLPGENPEKDNNLAPGDLITSIELPKSPFAARSYYLKVRDRASYAFALVSVAAALETDKAGKILQARIAMGGVAHKPWRSAEAEKVLVGKTAGEAAFKAAAEAAMKDARALSHNGFKVDLGKRAIVRALTRAADGGGAKI
jgi:xanthine dehydrogenase YagS FAD-binding subunit